MMGDSEKTDLPVGWVKCRLPDFTEIVMGQSPPSETYNADKIGLPFFQGKAEFGAIYPTVIKYCSLPNKIAEKGATLLSVRAPVGPTNIANLKCCIGRGLAAIHPLDAIEPAYIFYLLRSLEASISKEGTGSTFAAINKQFLEELGINLPPLPEQKRIVAKIEELFSELDKGIESFKTAREQLKVYRQALLKHAFEGKLTAAWREANKDKLETADALLKRIQVERAERYKQQVKEWEQATKEWEKNGKKGSKPGKPSKPKELPPLTAEELAELPQLPEGWGWTRLESITTEIDQGWSPKCENRPATETEWGVIKTTAIQHGLFNGLENKALPPQLLPREQHTLNVGDVLITRAGPRVRVGVCCLVRVVRKNLLNCDKVYRVRPISPLCCPDYLEGILNSPLILDNIEKIKSGINDSGVNLNQGAFLALAIPYCSKLEQEIIISDLEREISEVDNLDQTISTALQQAETLRQSILKKAFSGQLVSQDPNDEPAAALLARIKAERAANGGKAGSTSNTRTPRKKKATP